MEKDGKTCSTCGEDLSPRHLCPADRAALRDVFAASALNGIMASSPERALTDEARMARWIWKMADAMLGMR